jgi:hypothetical protein
MAKKEVINVVGTALYKYHFLGEKIEMYEEYPDSSEQSALFRFVREYLRQFTDPDRGYFIAVNGTPYEVTFSTSDDMKPIYYTVHIAKKGI